MSTLHSHDEEAGFELAGLLEDDARMHSGEIVERHSVSRNDERPQQQASSRPSTEYLDGLRGIAAVWVFVQHFMPTFTLGGHEDGFGQRGQYKFVSLPYVRLFFGSGGNAAVVVFFVLSGYVLSVGPLRKLKQDKSKDVRRGLLGALIRRPIRLYIPPLTISFIHALLLHVPGLMLGVPWLNPEEKTVGEEIEWWWMKSSEYFSIFREHGSNIFMFPYNIAVWTLPIELKGSILVYGILAIFSLGLRGPDPRAPLMVAVMMLGAGGIMLQFFWKWSMVCFMFGMILAIIDTWPIGEELRSLFERPQWMRIPDAILNRSPTWAKTTPSWVEDMRDRWESVRNVKVLPEGIRRRLPKRSYRPRSGSAKSTWFPHLCFFVGFYLLSEPAHAGDRNFSLETPGWVWLTKMIPEPYDDLRYYRYWQSWGAILGVYSVLRISWLQWFFSTRVLKFFGFVSFMLYLIHLPFFRIFPDRFNNLIGYNGDPSDAGTFWDKTWEIPDVGPTGLTSRFIVSMAVNFPLTLFVAWVATKSIDQPSVKLGKLITRLIGLDKPQMKKELEAVGEEDVRYTDKDFADGVEYEETIFLHEDEDYDDDDERGRHRRTSHESA